MLGRFLEQSIVTSDIRASHDFYVKLGFSPAAVGEAWTHPYAVLTDGRIHVGLHQDEAFQPSITFVKPELLKLTDQLKTLGVQLEFQRLAGDVFNEIGWQDPSGHLIRVVEARTFSPAQRRGDAASMCGYFTEIALPTPSMETAKNHWESLGFVGLDDEDGPLPHVACTSDTIDVGLYEPAALRAPTLMFEVDDFDATLARIKAAGLPLGRLPPPLNSKTAALLLSPEGTSMLLSAKA